MFWIPLFIGLVLGGAAVAIWYQGIVERVRKELDELNLKLGNAINDAALIKAKMDARLQANKVAIMDGRKKIE